MTGPDSLPSTDEQDVRARVESFVAEFHAVWRRSDATTWGREKQVLADRHFVPWSTYASDTARTDTPAHDPAHERIVSVVLTGARAEVGTELSDVAATRHYTYRLVTAGLEWRIDRIFETSGPAGAPLVPLDRADQLRSEMDAERLEGVVPEELASGIDGLFSARRRVIRLGSITTSGVLAVHDLGWARLDLAPFHRRVPAGTYVVEVSRDETDTNLAVRVRLSDDEVVARVPAERVGEGSEVSVDAGNVAVLDFTGVAAAPEGEVEAAFQHWADSGAPDTLLSLGTEETNTAVVTSGYGDGGYPLWWGLAADGSVVDLVVDFLVAVTDVVTTVTVPFAPGQVDQPDLVPLGLEVLARGDRVVLRHREAAGSSYVREVRVLGATGEPLPGRDGGVLVSGGWCEREWQPQHPVPDDAVLEVTVWQGYRHL